MSGCTDANYCHTNVYYCIGRCGKTIFNESSFCKECGMEDRIKKLEDRIKGLERWPSLIKAMDKSLIEDARSIAELRDKIEDLENDKDVIFVNLDHMQAEISTLKVLRRKDKEEKPTNKKSGWINIYQDIRNDCRKGGNLYENKEQAEMDIGNGWIACVKVEWEE